MVILQNPSKASKDISDQTVNKVLEVLYNFKYGKVYLTNLIPYYGTNSKEISELVKDVYCYKINRNGTPIHPTRNQWSSSSKEEDFVKCRI